jgi:hypothetical protein
MNRASRVPAAVLTNNSGNAGSLPSIVPEHHQMQRIPRTKTTPVLNANRRRTASFNQSPGDAVINAAAALNTRQDHY